MSRQFSPAVVKLIRDRMASGSFGSEDELLTAALHALNANDVELKAIEAGLASLDRGEKGVPLDDAVLRLQQKHQTQGQQ